MSMPYEADVLRCSMSGFGIGINSRRHNTPNIFYWCIVCMHVSGELGGQSTGERGVCVHLHRLVKIILCRYYETFCDC